MRLFPAILHKNTDFVTARFMLSSRFPFCTAKSMTLMALSFKAFAVFSISSVQCLPASCIPVQWISISTWRVQLFPITSLSRRTKWGIPPNLPRYCSWKTRSVSACTSVSQLTPPLRSKSISILSLNWSYLVNTAMRGTMKWAIES